METQDLFVNLNISASSEEESYEVYRKSADKINDNGSDSDTRSAPDVPLDDDGNVDESFLPKFSPGHSSDNDS